MNENFVQDVGSEKNGRDDKGASHAVPMGDFPVRFNAEKTRKEKECRDKVEARIKGRKVGHTHGTGF